MEKDTSLKNADIAKERLLMRTNCHRRLRYFQGYLARNTTVNGAEHMQVDEKAECQT